MRTCDVSGGARVLTVKENPKLQAQGLLQIAWVEDKSGKRAARADPLLRDRQLSTHAQRWTVRQRSNEFGGASAHIDKLVQRRDLSRLAHSPTRTCTKELGGGVELLEAVC